MTITLLCSFYGVFGGLLAYCFGFTAHNFFFLSLSPLLWTLFSNSNRQLYTCPNGRQTKLTTISKWRIEHLAAKELQISLSSWWRPKQSQKERELELHLSDGPKHNSKSVPILFSVYWQIMWCYCYKSSGLTSQPGRWWARWAIRKKTFLLHKSHTTLHVNFASL